MDSLRSLAITLGAAALSATLWSCGGRPEGVLSDKKAAEVMADMYVASAYSDASLSASPYDSARIKLALGVLESHGVTREQYDSTIMWYGRNMDEYEKLMGRVDKRLAARQKHLAGAEAAMVQNQGDNLWPYGPHAVISPLAASDMLTFSLDMPEVGSGDQLVWHMRTARPTGLQALLAAEYADGHATYVTSTGGMKPVLELTLQTDTGAQVTRVAGYVHISDRMSLPALIDSISLLRLPPDSAEMTRNLSLRRTLKPKANPAPRVPAPRRDSTDKDTTILKPGSK